MTHVHTIPPHGGDALTHRPFQITVVHADQDRAQVTATGPLDRSTVDLLTAVLQTMLGWGRRHVRLDMSRVTVTDEGCLPALVQVHEMFLAERGLLVLTLPRPDLTALLRQRRLERALFIAEETAGAVARETRRGRVRRSGQFPWSGAGRDLQPRPAGHQPARRHPLPRRQCRKPFEAVSNAMARALST